MNGCKLKKTKKAFKKEKGIERHNERENKKKK
jgi:hypothetical protein